MGRINDTWRGIADAASIFGRGIADAASIFGRGMYGKIVKLPGVVRSGAAVLSITIGFVALQALFLGCSSGEAPRIEGLTAQQWYQKGHDLWENGRYTRTGEAVVYFNRAIELDSDFARAYNSRGIAYDHLKRYVLAIEDFDEAISLDEGDKSAYNNRGITLKKMGELEDALEDFDRATEIDPEYKAAYNNRGNVFRMMGQHARAIKDFDRAVEIDPDYARALTNRSESYFALRDKTRACRDKRRACELGDRRGCRAARRNC